MELRRLPHQVGRVGEAIIDELKHVGERSLTDLFIHEKLVIRTFVHNELFVCRRGFLHQPLRPADAHHVIVRSVQQQEWEREKFLLGPQSTQGPSISAFQQPILRAEDFWGPQGR